MMLVAFVCLGTSASLVTGQDRANQDRANQAEAARQKLYEAAQSIIAPELVGRDLERDLNCLSSLKAIREHLAALEKEYAVDIREGNQPYRNVEGTIRYTRERIDQFQNALTNYASMASIAADAEHVRRMLKMAVENQAPAYFNEGNDIANRRLAMRSKLQVMKELGAAELTKANESLARLDAEVLAEQKKLAQSIIDNNRLPTDSYAQGDREELLKLINETWLKTYPKRPPLQIGLIGNDWRRTEQWEVQNRTLYKVNRSQIQGFVIVAHDTKTAACYHVQIRRDHVDNDRTAAWIMDDAAKEPEPRQLIPAALVRAKSSTPK